MNRRARRSACPARRACRSTCWRRTPRSRFPSGRLSILTAGEARLVRVEEISSVVLHGGASLTAPSLTLLAEGGVPLILCSRNGYCRGQLVGLSSGSATRRAQYAAATDEARRLLIARGLVRGKIALAARLAARRDGRRCVAARRLATAAEAAGAACDLAELRGVEGAARGGGKTKTARRDVPLASALVEAGLLRVVQAAGDGYLFPHLWRSKTGTAAGAIRRAVAEDFGVDAPR